MRTVSVVALLLGYVLLQVQVVGSLALLLLLLVDLAQIVLGVLLVLRESVACASVLLRSLRSQVLARESRRRSH